MEGFKGERWLTVTSVILSIISTALLIKLSVMQHEYTKIRLEEEKNNKEKKNGN